MDQQEWLACQFEEQRPHLRAVAYRMLGSRREADDAVQDAWLPVSRADTSEVENLHARPTTSARGGDFDALVAVLDPNVVLRADGGDLTDLSRHVRGAKAVAGQALWWSSQVDLTIRRALVNGAPGIVTIRDGRPFSVGAFTVKNRKIVEVDFLADPARVARLDLNVLDE